MDYSNLDDSTLIRLIAHAKTDALSELYDRYFRQVFGLALAVIKDRAAAEEITQDVFLRVWENAKTYQGDRANVFFLPLLLFTAIPAHLIWPISQEQSQDHLIPASPLRWVYLLSGSA